MRYTDARHAPVQLVAARMPHGNVCRICTAQNRHKLDVASVCARHENQLKELLTQLESQEETD